MEKNEKKELLCFGNAIVDIFAALDPSRMDALGITEQVQHISPQQARRVMDALDGFSRSSGGGAANAAKIAALLGIHAAFAGCAGNDEIGAFFENELRGAGVVPLLKKANSPGGTCLVLRNGDVNGEEIRIAASPAAALEFSADDIREEMFDSAEIAVIVIDGYILDRRPLVSRILRLARERKIPVALDAASTFIVRKNAAGIAQWLAGYPLILFMNADESIAFYRAVTKTESPAAQPEEIFSSEREKEEFILREICPMLKDFTADRFPVIVVKLGERGALAAAGGKIYRQETTAVKPRNTTGAGDAFCAAFLAAWIREKTVPECLALGNAVAGKTLETNGTAVQAKDLASCARALQSKTD